MVNGLDLLGHNRTFQIHWAKRVLAFAIDLAFVFAPLWILLFYADQRSPLVYGLWGGLTLYLYSTFAESLFRATVGKYIVGLEVRSLRGPMTASKAAVRNIPKLFWFAFPVLDTLAGLLVEGDPRQRWSDKVLGTTVAQSSLIHVRVHRLDGVGAGPRG
ncbi:MAG: RDD family protein [Methanobacteriota archaeon]